MFHNQTTLDRDSLKKYAAQVGLDRKQFDADFDSGKYEPVVRHDIEDGEGYGVEATPTFFINGRRHDGPFDLSSLSEAIEQVSAY